MADAGYRAVEMAKKSTAGVYGNLRMTGVILEGSGSTLTKTIAVASGHQKNPAVSWQPLTRMWLQKTANSGTVLQGIREAQYWLRRIIPAVRLKHPLPAVVSMVTVQAGAALFLRKLVESIQEGQSC